MATSTIKSDIQGTWQDVPNANILTLRYINRRGVCYLNIYDNASYSLTSGWNIVGYLPSGCRPSVNVCGSWANRDGKTGEIQIGTDGSVNLYPHTTGKQFVSASVAVPIA